MSRDVVLDRQHKKMVCTVGCVGGWVRLDPGDVASILKRERVGRVGGDRRGDYDHRIKIDVRLSRIGAPSSVQPHTPITH